MVSEGRYDWRKADIMDQAEFPEVRYLIDKGYDPYIYELELYQEAPDTEAEIRENFTNELDGTTTAVKVRIVSNDAKDAAAGVGARTVKIFGIGSTTANGTQAYQEETLSMNGTTHVTTSLYWSRIINGKVMTAGSETDPAGTIVINELGGTSNVYLTIAAAKLGSVNARFYVHTGKFSKILQLDAHVIQVTGASAAVLDCGATFRPIFVNSATGLADKVLHAYSIVPAGAYKLPPHWEVRTGGITHYYTLKHATVNTSVNKDVHYDMKILVW